MKASKLGRWFRSLVARLTTKRSKKIALISLGVVVGLLLIFQIFYPRDRALPGTILGDQDISGWTDGDISHLASELYKRSTVEVEGSDKTMLGRNLSAVGVAIDFDQVAEQATSYSFWLRLVPTSIFWAGSAVGAVEAGIDQGKLDTFVADNEANFVISPENAKLVVDGSVVKIQDEVKGARLSADQFKSGVKSTKYILGGPTILDVKFSYTEPDIKKSDLEPLRSRANEIISRDITLEFEQTRELVDKATLASWIVFNQAEAKSASDITIDLNNDNVLQFVHAKFDKVVAIPAGVTDVHLTDGIEQSRTTGPDGRAVDDTLTSAEIKRVLLEAGSDASLAVPARSVPASIKKHHTFTKSQRGLQAYLNSLADEGDIKVSVTQMGGAGWSASYRAAEQTVAASTYKVYVVAYALDQIAEGKLSYDDEVNGTTFRECMTRAIVRSDNACPEAMLAKFGRSTVNEYFYARGYSRATNLNHSTASQTSASDLVRAMIEIENGTLLKGGERSFMIGLMREQVYRQGIPAGTSAVAAGKVGFLWGYLNDTAIVYHPSGTYALSVMTNNASWSKIAEITRKIESIMY